MLVIIEPKFDSRKTAHDCCLHDLRTNHSPVRYAERLHSPHSRPRTYREGGGNTQARQWQGHEPLRALSAQVVVAGGRKGRQRRVPRAVAPGEHRAG